MSQPKPSRLESRVSTPQIIAHRGASWDAPENTRVSIELAWQQGADAAEVDIHLSQSGEIVVMHDKNTLRTTGFDGEIAALTWDELKKLDAGAWKSSQFAGESIPTLDELMTILPQGKRLYIEIKASEPILKPLQACLEQAAIAPEQIVIIGFNYSLMKAAKLLFSNVEVLWLRGKELLKDLEKEELASLFTETIQLCREANLDGLDLSHEWFEAGFPLNEARALGLKSCAFTVNDGALACRLAEMGVDGITTARPGFIRAQLQEASWKVENK